ncbi:MAG TPA: HD domain-containing protein [Mucilaginibacter sp.]|nr:HD domain-containing protein [Mucilaginibacter sp.]
MQLEQAGTYILHRLETELPPALHYHNAAHTRNVYKAAKQLGEAEGITGDELTMLLTAAYYHDCGFLVKVKGHEEESCRIARDILPGFGYNTTETDRICGMIMATRLPQSPQNHLEEILADADLDYLGREDFFIVGDKLFAENLLAGTIKNREEWDCAQVAFITNHRYFTKSAINLREAKKEANLERVKAQQN